jgi:hypothetical protein
MAKVNVYLPDDLAEAVRASDVNVSQICQAALREVLDVKAEDQPVTYELLEIADRLRETARFGDKPQLYGVGYDQGWLWAQRSATAHDLQLLERGDARSVDKSDDPWAIEDWESIDMELFDTLYEWYFDNIAPQFTDSSRADFTIQYWRRTPLLEGFVDGAMEIWKRVQPLLDPASAEKARRALDATRPSGFAMSDEPPF